MAARPGPRPTHDVMENLPSFKGVPGCPSRPRRVSSRSSQAAVVVAAAGGSSGWAAEPRTADRRSVRSLRAAALFARGVLAQCRAVPARIGLSALRRCRAQDPWFTRQLPAARGAHAAAVQCAGGCTYGAGCAAGACLLTDCGCRSPNRGAKQRARQPVCTEAAAVQRHLRLFRWGRQRPGQGDQAPGMQTACLPTFPRA